jgi:hypothetical protein
MTSLSVTSDNRAASWCDYYVGNRPEPPADPKKEEGDTATINRSENASSLLNDTVEPIGQREELSNSSAAGRKKRKLQPKSEGGVKKVTRKRKVAVKRRRRKRKPAITTNNTATKRRRKGGKKEQSPSVYRRLVYPGASKNVVF